MKTKLINVIWPLMPNLTFVQIRAVAEKMEIAAIKEGFKQC